MQEFTRRQFVANASVVALLQADGQAVPIQLEITAPSGPSWPAEPIPIRIALTNTSKDPQAVTSRLAPVYGMLDISVRCPDGQTRKRTPLIIGTFTPEKDLVVLAPGASLHTVELLHHAAQGQLLFDQVGTYKIQATLRSFTLNGVGSHLLNSNVLNATVTEPPQKPHADLLRLFRGKREMLLLLGFSNEADLARRFEAVATQEGLGRYEIYVHWALGNYYFAVKRLDAAIREFDFILARWPGS